MVIQGNINFNRTKIILYNKLFYNMIKPIKLSIFFIIKNDMFANDIYSEVITNPNLMTLP